MRFPAMVFDHLAGKVSASMRKLREGLRGKAERLEAKARPCMDGQRVVRKKRGTGTPGQRQNRIKKEDLNHDAR